MSLSTRIHTALAEANMNQSQLARMVGLKKTSVNGWATGKTKTLEGENLLKAAAALGVNANWLATGRGLMRPTTKAQGQPNQAEHDSFTIMSVPNEVAPSLSALLSLYTNGAMTANTLDALALFANNPTLESLASFTNKLSPNIRTDSKDN